MILNQLYHDLGVARTREQHSVSVDLRAKHASEALQADHLIRNYPAGEVASIAPTADTFEVFRVDEVQVTSTQFAGGDWRWRLADATGETLVQGGGYHSERSCRAAVALLRGHAHTAT